MDKAPEKENPKNIPKVPPTHPIKRKGEIT